jgi:hypothetical protein
VTRRDLYGLQRRARETIGDTVSQSFDGVEYSVRYYIVDRKLRPSPAVAPTPTPMFLINGKRVSRKVWWENAYDGGWPTVASNEVAA